ncbi:DUF559 domain-containing protein [Microbacterium sp. 22242]|uniref:DUF559 domain-containing protein n=1 Tax=Microbacterium sp. 22242 TaxID=3453896 RepID=UPI003F85D00B
MLSAPDTLARIGGIATGARLQELGFSRRSLARLVQKGVLERIRPGVFALPRIEADVRTAAAHGGALSCVSVLRRLKVWVLSDSDALHVWLGPNHHAQQHDGCTCVSHFYRGTPAPGHTDLETALVHLYRCQGDEAFFASFESAWRKGLLFRSARARIRAALPQTARWLIDLARPDADSGLESLLRLRLHLLGIQLDCQVRIHGVGVVDFVVAGRLILEADGKENHDGSSQRHRDRQRDAIASRLGYETLRFDYAQIIHDWPTVQAAILAALARHAA